MLLKPINGNGQGTARIANDPLFPVLAINIVRQNLERHGYVLLLSASPPATVFRGRQKRRKTTPSGHSA